ncbi:hypothetical protein DACRYDRAFT_114347 [Dacryopinax primogenitus]|uniref:Zn(2)-C6 fungal-type domain-containing protein n=1 Tax=Dacryopinax primogenitus (strain DJM 731) TaxID=1858805 RepID=M5G470_DACPD|nr:uncharacterized protein DACRYDRAFT_114347 [Dacryopinax primogenitus]EJU05061.1 hypothetical protein DACRYDRAFT_114347 [Dacryopinax primogenitus]
MSRPRLLRKANVAATAKMHALAAQGALDDSDAPSPTSSVISLSSPARKTRSSNATKKSKKAATGTRTKRNDTGRSKTGCWTCRVRRKKCGGHSTDDPDSECIDCVRLHIQCLGWGDKRPAWLRQPGASVLERKKIKQDLLTRGRVKGQKREEEDIKPKIDRRTASPPVLVSPPKLALNDEEFELVSDDEESDDLGFMNEPSSTPASTQHSERDSSPFDDDLPDFDEPAEEAPMPVLVKDDVAANNDLTFRGPEEETLPIEFSQPGWGTSWDIQRDFTGMYPGLGIHYPNMYPSIPLDHIQPSAQLDLITSEEFDPSVFNDMSLDLSGWAPDMQFDQELSSDQSSPIGPMQDAFVNLHTMDGPLSPGTASTPDTYVMPEVITPASTCAPLSPYYDFNPPMPLPITPVSPVNQVSQFSPQEVQCFRYYLTRVLPLQHVLSSDQHKQEVVRELVQRFPRSSTTMLCLALVHQLHQLNKDKTVPVSTREQILHQRNVYWYAAKEQLFSSPQLTLERAVLAVHMLDCSLFTACQPNIEYFRYRSILRAFCLQINVDGNAHSLVALMARDRIMDYVVKSAFWMDVVGAISKKSRPMYLDYFQALSKGPRHQMPFDMSEMVGCDTEIMFAFAEIAELEVRKMKHHASMSLQTLCRDASRIEAQIKPGRYTVVPSVPLLFPHPAHETHNPFSAGYPIPPTGIIQTPLQQYMAQTMESKDTQLRRLVSDAFRGAASAYLWAVVNGWRPRVDEIRTAVAETINALRDISSTHEHPVDRALVLPFFMAGVLTEDPSQQDFIRGRMNNVLDRECGTFTKLLEVLEEVWHRRSQCRGHEVCFREVMRDINTECIMLA